MSEKNICIIGAGIGGLTAAALLIKNNYKVTIFEKEKMVGGRALSFNGSEIDLEKYKKLLENFNMRIAFSEPNIKKIFDKKMLEGYCLDLGYHAIGGGVLSNLNSILSELNMHSEFLESYVGLIKNDGYDFPFLSKTDKIKILPNILRLVFASEKKLRKLDKISMSETIKRYGKGKMKDILEIFSRSITTINDLDKISTGEMLRAQKNLYKGSKPVGYPKGGLGNITKKLRKYILDNGGKIKLESKVEKIIIENNKAHAIIVDNKKQEFDIIISNILIQNLFTIADDKHFKNNYINDIKALSGTGSLCAYHSLKSINHELIGKTFHFIERNTNFDGKDIVGMIDFMSADKDAGLSPNDSYLVQSYIICTPNEAKDPEALKKLKGIIDKNLEILLPNYKEKLNWALYPTIWHLDGVAKTIDKQKPEIKTPIKNLFLVGDCVKSPGIGFNCAINSAKILSKEITNNNS